MPTVIRFGKIKIMIYPNDHNPPHVHILVAGQSVAIAIEDGSVLIGPLPRGCDEAMAWILANREALMAKWAELHQTQRERRHP